MDELRESSLLFSLEGLMETERERVQREAREAQARREGEIRRVAEVAERRNLQARQEREARERREALSREREQMEHERLEALKLATIERARIEAESGLRLVEAEQARKHALALSQIREQQGAARYRALTWLSATALAVALIGSFSAYFGWIAPAHARAEQHLESKLREGAARESALALRLAAEQSNNRALSAQIQHVQQAIVASPPVAVAPPKSLKTSTPTPPTTQLRSRCTDSGDPLDNCLR